MEKPLEIGYEWIMNDIYPCGSTHIDVEKSTIGRSFFYHIYVSLP